MRPIVFLPRSSVASTGWFVYFGPDFMLNANDLFIYLGLRLAKERILARHSSEATFFNRIQLICSLNKNCKQIPVRYSLSSSDTCHTKQMSALKAKARAETCLQAMPCSRTCFILNVDVKQKRALQVVSALPCNEKSKRKKSRVCMDGDSPLLCHYSRPLPHFSATPVSALYFCYPDPSVYLSPLIFNLSWSQAVADCLTCVFRVFTLKVPSLPSRHLPHLELGEDCKNQLANSRFGYNCVVCRGQKEVSLLYLICQVKNNLKLYLERKQGKCKRSVRSLSGASIPGCCVQLQTEGQTHHVEKDMVNEKALTLRFLSKESWSLRDALMSAVVCLGGSLKK